MRRIDHQTYMVMREGAEVLEADHYGDKVLRLSDGTFLKLFRRKRLLSSAAWYPYAQRFVDNAVGLQRIGVPVPAIIDVVRIPSISRDAVHYHPLEGETFRSLARQDLDEETKARLKNLFVDFVCALHDKGVYFRSLHLGNVVLLPDGRIGLIDIADLRLFVRPLRRMMRQRNMRHMQRNVDEREWIDVSRILRER